MTTSRLKTGVEPAATETSCRVKPAWCWDQCSNSRGAVNQQMFKESRASIERLMAFDVVKWSTNNVISISLLSRTRNVFELVRVAVQVEKAEIL